MRRQAILHLLVAAALGASCTRRPPNVVLITLDTTRADHLGAYGDRRARTPNLDRLAAAGVLFERAITVAPLTLPAHASLLTGLYPFAHGVRNNGNFALRDNVPTVATALRRAGYRTAAFVSAFVLDRRSGMARGFDAYDDRLELERRGADTVAAAARWLADGAGDSRPFFVWVHLYDPHDPYDPPPPYREAFADRLYDGEIAFDDEAIGTLLERVDAAAGERTTAVAVAGDHGESLGEHGEATHGLLVYESTIRVPLIVVAPSRVAAGRRVPALVRTIDLAPTLLEIAGVEPPGGIQGRSLLPLAAGRAPGPGEAYSETYFPQLYMNWAPLRSIQDGRWKFIDAPVPELYDLANDSGELDNVAPREPGRTAALRVRRRHRGRRWRDDGDARGPRDGPETGSARLHRRVWRATLSGCARGHVAPRSQGDDRRLQPAAGRECGDSAASSRRRRSGGARRPAARSRQRVCRDDSGAFRDGAGSIWRGGGRLPPLRHARPDERRRASLGRHLPFALRRCGRRARRGGRRAGARPATRRGARLARRSARCWRPHREAIAALRAAVEIAPDNVAYRIGLACVFIGAGSLADADVEIRRALALQPENPDALAASGSLLAAQGQPDAARIAFERALAHRPDDDDVRLDYAGVLERLDRRAEAKAQYERLARGRDTPEAIRRAAAAHLR